MTATGAPEPDPQLVADIDALFTEDDEVALFAANLTIPTQWGQQ